MTQHFSALVVPPTPRRTIILDIDGTVLADGDTHPGSDVVEAIARLRESHDIHLCSNNVDPERSRAIAAELGLPLLPTRHRKPDVRVIEGLSMRHPILVIGDKYLTDEVFARRIRAEFIRVERVVSPHDAHLTRLVYLIDDAAFAFAKAMKRFV